MTLEIEDSLIHKAVHVNSEGESVVYYSATVYYRHDDNRSSVSSDWIAVINGKLITDTDCYVDYCSEYYLEDFPFEEIHKFQDISLVNNYSSEAKRKIYQLFTKQLSTELVGYEKELSAIYCNSL